MTEVEIIEVYEDDLEEVTNTDLPKKSWWRRALSRLGVLVPGLTRACPHGNVHWRWHRICLCGFGTVSSDPVWHGGVADLKLGNELVPCAECYPETGAILHQWSLTPEEEVLLQAWRSYRTEVLSEFDRASYRYDISVKLNESVETYLMGRTVGLTSLAGGTGMFAGSVRSKGSSGEKPN